MLLKENWRARSNFISQRKLKWQRCLHILGAASELQKSKNKAEKPHSVCSLSPGPVTGCFIDAVCTSMPSGKATWSSAPGWTMGCSPSRSLWSLHRTWDSQTSGGRNHTGDSAISPCICSDESLENVAITAVSAFAFSAPVFISWTLSKGSVKDPGQESLNKLADSLKHKMSLCPLAAA